jgi:hypothetical protein
MTLRLLYLKNHRFVVAQSLSDMFSFFSRKSDATETFVYGVVIVKATWIPRSAPYHEETTAFPRHTGKHLD